MFGWLTGPTEDRPRTPPMEFVQLPEPEMPPTPSPTHSDDTDLQPLSPSPTPSPPPYIYAGYLPHTITPTMPVPRHRLFATADSQPIDPTDIDLPEDVVVKPKVHLAMPCRTAMMRILALVSLVALWSPEDEATHVFASLCPLAVLLFNE